MLQFRRVTTQKRFIPQIDGLRLVAITSVVLFHLYAALERGAIPCSWIFNTGLAKRRVELFFAPNLQGILVGALFVQDDGAVALNGIGQ
jgi:peptidoglycan/LPS O-acetylase OafA/YrhL